MIHFAGYKAVGESVAKPIEYYYNNMAGTLLLCDTMRKNGGGRERLAVVLVLAAAAGVSGCVFRYRHRRKHEGEA